MKMPLNKDIVNWKETLVMCNNKEDLASDLINMLREDLSRQHQDLKDAFAEKDILKMRNIIHQMQGSCSYVSLPQLKESAEALQNLLHTPNSNYKVAFEVLDAAITDVLKELPQS